MEKGLEDVGIRGDERKEVHAIHRLGAESESIKASK